MFVADIFWMPEKVEEKTKVSCHFSFFTPIKSRKPLQKWRNPQWNPSKNTYILYWFAVNFSTQIHPFPQRTGVRTWDLYLEGRPRSSDWFLVPLIIYIILFFQLWGCVSVSVSLSLSVRYIYICMYIYIYWVCMYVCNVMWCDVMLCNVMSCNVM
jgi:hypothetical protein